MSDESPAPGTSVNATLFNSKIEEEAGKVVGVVLGGTAEGVMSLGSNIFGGLIGDRVREWRNRNLINGLAETAAILKQKGVSLKDAKGIPMAEAYAMFEESSKQDDPTISSMWSALLANAMDENCDVVIEPAIVSTLKVLSGAEANLMRFIREFRAVKDHFSKSQPKMKSSGQDKDQRQKDIDDHSAAQKRHNQDFEKQAADVKAKYIGNLKDDKMDIALAHLVKEGCICVHAPNFSSRDLTTKQHLEHVGYIDVLDPRKVSDAMNEIAASVDEHSGRIDTLPKLFRPRMAQSRIAFNLTEYGQRLLTVCEPIIAEAKPSE